MPKVLSIEKIKELECGKQIGQFKNLIDMRFLLETHTELYVELEKEQICMLLYPIFGSVNLLEGDKQFTKLTQNTRAKILNVFNKIVQNKSENGQFVNRFRHNYNSVCIDQQLLEKENSIWKRIAPRALAKSYEDVYFGLTQFDGQWQSPNRQEFNKKVLVMPFRNEDKIILGFYQTKKSFSVAQINQIPKEQVLPIQQKKSLPPKTQEKLEEKLENQKEMMVKVKTKNEKVKISKFYEKFSFGTIYIIFIILLSLMVFGTYFHPSSIRIHVLNTSNSLIFKGGLFQSEKERIDKFMESYKQEVVQEGRQVRHYFTNPLHNTSVEINKNHPQLAESVSTFIQESQPKPQKNLQQIVL